MLIVQISDPYLLAAVRRCAHPEEEVITDRTLAEEAIALGYPRMIVLAASEGVQLPGSGVDARVPVLRIAAATLARWEVERRSAPVPTSRTRFTASRLGAMIEKQAGDANWVDRALADLTRAGGRALPPALRAFARRVLEFPSHYDDLRPLAESCGLSRGALKARFRRRSLPSPYAYLRWLRMIAVANVLADRSVTVAQAATRLGFTSDGNLCRTMLSVTGLTPTEARTLRGWNRLLIHFAWTHLGADAIAAWSELEELFLRRSA